jgi:hypothetical protein
MQLEKTLLKPLCLRAAPSGYIIFIGVFCFPILLLGIIAAVKDPSMWKGVAATLILMIVWAAWLASFRIVLTHDTISYTTIRGTVSMALSEIDKAEIHVGEYQYKDRFRPTIRLELHPYKGIGKKPMVINLKVFGKQDIRLLLKYLNVHNDA